MVIGPTEVNVPCFGFQGLVFPILADLPEGGYLQVVEGMNPLLPATPGPQLPKGAMLALIPPDLAAHFRPHVKKVQDALPKVVPS